MNEMNPSHHWDNIFIKCCRAIISLLISDSELSNLRRFIDHGIPKII